MTWKLNNLKNVPWILLCFDFRKLIKLFKAMAIISLFVINAEILCKRMILDCALVIEFIIGDVLWIT